MTAVDTPPVDTSAPGHAGRRSRSWSSAAGGGTGRAAVDAVEGAVRLRARVEAELGAVLDGALPTGDVYVGWVAALDVAACPARYRAGGEEGWGFPGWSPVLAAATVGRAALARHLRETARPGSGPVGDGVTPPLPHPVDTVRDWLREAARAPTSSVAEWVRDLARDGDRAALAATAAAAGRWLAGFVRVIGWPLPERFGLVVDDPEAPGTRRWHRSWRLPHRARADRRPKVTVAGGPDAVAGKVSPAGQFDLLVHRPSSPGDGALVDRAAHEAAAGALASGLVPRAVVVTTADTGERARCPVDADLLDRGVAHVVEVVRQRVVAAAAGWTFDDGTPSAACRHCPARDRCGPGQRWLAGPGRWRGGLPVLPPDGIC
jgi:hypothetical protein